MHKQIAATGFFLFSFLLPIRATAATFKQLFVFGDSLSDTGNVFNVTQGIFPQNPPYFNGRLSNGPLWVDTLADKLGLNPTLFTDVSGTASPTDGVNFAFVGANTGNDNIGSLPFLPLPGLQTEIDSFENNFAASADPDALYIVFAGGNDYLFGGVTDPTVPVTNISTAITSLFNVGARNFLVPNLPDLGKTPNSLSRGSDISNGLNQLTGLHNSGLTQTLNSLSQSLTGINVISLDVNSLFNNVIANPQEFGFTDVTNSCLTNFNSPIDFSFNVCDNPDNFWFWDDVHPTTASHRLIGDIAFSALNSEHQETVPEPASVLGILALGVLGAGSMLKRKR